ncbi:expressed unknown protein [Seminavis robusta]|uniref:Uncharacterized protein n=1 Tax=Seminavis robusta TaxID=568900 RepID=A0A9N8HUD7_9STRA|nr:expressed unknown protein [Seminavis robusta]|eukprot:Sro1370_g267020.1 n/a (239) ;mRNA; f:15795-16511
MGSHDDSDVHCHRRKIHRDQHQIRHRFLHRLGITCSASITGDKPSITMGTVRTIPKLSSNINKDSSSSSNDTTAMELSSSSTSSSYRRRVTFALSTTNATREIPSHRDYDEETRSQIWMGMQEIEENARRNRLEFLADGCDYQRATEEKQMIKWHQQQDDESDTTVVELVHPATYWFRYQQEQDKILRQQEQEHHQYIMTKQQKGEHAFSTPWNNSRHDASGIIKKSPTAMSLAGMAA